MPLIERMFGKFNNMRIQRKLVFSFFVVVVVPLAISGGLFTYTLYHTAINRATEQTENNMNKVLTRINDVINVPIVISHKAQLDQELKQLVTTRYRSVLEIVKAYSTYTEFTDTMRLYDEEIGAIRVYSNNTTALESWGLLQYDGPIRKYPWHTETIRNNGLIGWELVEDETHNYMKSMSLVRKISFGAKEPIYGILVVSIKQEALDEIVRQEPFDTYIISDKDQILAAKDSSLLGQSIGKAGFDVREFQQMTKGFTGRTSFDMNINGTRMKAIVNRFLPSSSAAGITVVAMVPYDTILKDVNKANAIALSIMFVSLLLASLLIYFFSTQLSARIRTLCAEIKTVSLGNLNVTSTIEGKDEFGQLATHFNQMVDSIKNLISTVAESNNQKHQLLIQQKEMKFKMLANQINPHFLFNTLETIRMKAYVKGDQEVATAVLQLGMLMRRSLNLKSERIPLADELSFATDYLEIQRFRYGDRLKYSIEVEHLSLYKQLVPAFIIQPIIENAVIHGLECKEEDGFIQLGVSYNNRGILITVQDNGLGMGKRKLEDIQALLKQEEVGEGTSIGICNVHQRISLQYGDEFGLRIDSEEGIGTRVEIHLPQEVDTLVQSASGR